MTITLLSATTHQPHYCLSPCEAGGRLCSPRNRVWARAFMWSRCPSMNDCSESTMFSLIVVGSYFRRIKYRKPHLGTLWSAATCRHGRSVGRRAFLTNGPSETPTGGTPQLHACASLPRFSLRVSSIISSAYWQQTVQRQRWNPPLNRQSRRSAVNAPRQRNPPVSSLTAHTFRNIVRTGSVFSE